MQQYLPEKSVGEYDGEDGSEEEGEDDFAIAKVETALGAHVVGVEGSKNARHLEQQIVRHECASEQPKQEVEDIHLDGGGDGGSGGGGDGECGFLEKTREIGWRWRGWREREEIDELFESVGLRFGLWPLLKILYGLAAHLDY